MTLEGALHKAPMTTARALSSFNATIIAIVVLGTGTFSHTTPRGLHFAVPTRVLVFSLVLLAL